MGEKNDSSHTDRGKHASEKIPICGAETWLYTKINGLFSRRRRLGNSGEFIRSKADLYIYVILLIDFSFVPPTTNDNEVIDPKRNWIWSKFSSTCSWQRDFLLDTVIGPMYALFCLSQYLYLLSPAGISYPAAQYIEQYCIIILVSGEHI